ncbi:hypothetical protein N0V83_010318 [Neocucurbitaria cava]|uniref:Uncharacterized protein n=1 Tax=Neocucurbitaria cava TaxID=798079 RepID=A0A9W8XZN9_9PLEO|nr:hypothetical protein N0V83_010318 [Neocucurbitaria cava]
MRQNRYGVEWFVYLGAVLCGISAGFFWSVEGAITTGYPENHKRGRYIATWFTFRNFGNIIGGAVSLSINHKTNHKGKVGYQTIGDLLRYSVWVSSLVSCFQIRRKWFEMMVPESKHQEESIGVWKAERCGVY